MLIFINSMQVNQFSHPKCFQMLTGQGQKTLFDPPRAAACEIFLGGCSPGSHLAPEDRLTGASVAVLKFSQASCNLTSAKWSLFTTSCTSKAWHRKKKKYIYIYIRKCHERVFYCDVEIPSSVKYIMHKKHLGQP